MLWVIKKFFKGKKNSLEQSKKKKPEEQYFIKQLWEKSEDFKMLEKMVEESEGKISWEKLKEYTRIKDWKVEWIYWKGDLDLSWTSIKSLWKLKKVWWKLDLWRVESLEELWELEEVWWDWDLRWTRIRSLWKLREVWWKLDLRWVESLEDLGELEEVRWYLYLRWTNIDVQIKALKRKRTGGLKVRWRLMVDTDIEEVFGEDLVNWERLKERLKERYGDNIKDIEDEKLRISIEEILKIYLELHCKETIEKIAGIIRDDKISNEDRKMQIEELNKKYEEEKRRIENFLWKEIDLDCR